MHVFYNRKGIGDCLIVPLKQGDRYQIDFNQYGHVTKIYDTESKEVLGYNIFREGSNMELEDGKHKLDEVMLAKINQILDRHGVPESLELDLSPKFVVGYVKTKEPHENADKLNVCQVDIGTETVQIVCGAPNVDAGQHVVVAKVGAIMPSGMEIKEANLRGVDSFGMICSQKELGLPNAPEEKGIYVLTGDLKAGETFDF
ncbi:tRNA-binding protein [Natronobacillus azotifigens]|uniref:DUF4479 domain-containing protein n=1 Tax=Natronobacillus azotifigens TaxID=472978 RepID=A0A9J6RC20_9BACI|nr:DUF4479 domain-containing tRNA-binding protein [Natronobacillus azotifigens]MCZ0703242.1 DUF4479 domain-containing protein [Natronobacillus azotifigens]